MTEVARAVGMARKLGGKRGLNCIAEMDSGAGREEGLRAGEGPLAGVPVLVKDNVDVRGLHTCAGSLALEDNLAVRDAPVVRRLRENGAVILGKTNMTEMANYVTRGMPGGYSSRGGQVVHAADPSLSPSGSSSGSAVAVAAGIVPMAVGTDTSFSIIACARANGVCGLKPPAGTLPSEGIIPIAPTLDSAGPLAGTFPDALRMYRVMRDTPLDMCGPLPVRGLCLAVNRYGEERLDAGERAYLRRLTARLEQMGASVEEIRQETVPDMMTIMQWEFRPALEAYLRSSAASLKTLGEIVAYYESHPDTMMRYGDGFLRAALDETPGGLRGEPYLRAMAVRREMRSAVLDALRPYDCVVMTGPTNIMHFCGLPSATVCAGEKDAHGVRRGLILYGAEEGRLYGAALALENEMEQMAQAGQSA